MKRFFKILFPALALSYPAFSQKSIELIETIPPNSISIQDYAEYLPGFKSTFILYLKHGATIFNTKEDLILVDSQTFEEKGRMKYPKIDGQEIIKMDGRELKDVKHKVVLFSKKKDQKSGITYCYGSIIDETFKLSAPEKLFPMLNDEFSLRYEVNERKDLILISDEFENKKEKKKMVYSRLFNNNLKLLKSDSVVISTLQADTISTLITDNGYAMISMNNLKREIKLYNAATGDLIKFSINGNIRNPLITKIKQAGDKVILCGNYYSVVAKKDVINGIFKIVYNTKSNKTEDEIYFDHIRQGKDEMESQRKFIESSYISENGSCFVIIYQGYNATSGGGYSYNSAGSFVSSGAGISEFKKYKYEIMCITNTGEKWRKQLPINDFQAMYTINNTLYIACHANPKYDFNNFVYENSLILKKNLYALSVDAYKGFIKVPVSGELKYQTVSYKDGEPTESWISIKKQAGALKTKNLDFLKIVLTE